MNLRTAAVMALALYALALGAGPTDLDYLLEPEPKVLPTWAVIPALIPVFAALQQTGGDLLKLLHTGQRTALHRPFPPEGVVSTTAQVHVGSTAMWKDASSPRTSEVHRRSSSPGASRGSTA